MRIDAILPVAVEGSPDTLTYRTVFSSQIS